MTVATFDHRTGEHSTRAAALVALRARELGLPLVAGRRAPVTDADESEATLRDERWRFLRRVARERDAVIATAHTRDDQVETVLMRAMRGAGARGMAGLYAASDVERPFLELDRSALVAYARARAARWEEDPTNVSRAYFRNRVRLDLLPALRLVRPALDAELLDLARRAAALRREVETVAAGIGRVVPHRPAAQSPGFKSQGAPELHVALPELSGYDQASLRLLWPALGARLGVSLDRRGTCRVAEFSRSGATGTVIQLSGGWEVVRRRGHLILRRAAERNPEDVSSVSLQGEVRIGSWRFRPVEAAVKDLWHAALPIDALLTVRPWRPGDRLRAEGMPGPRRVKRFLTDAGIVGPDRAGWPVVLVGSEIVWIPGIRRSDAATVRPGAPVTCYRCERIDG